MNQRHLTLLPEAQGERLDKALAQAAGDLSRTAIQRLLKEGAISHEGQIVTNPREKVAGGEAYLLLIPDPTPIEAQPEAIPLDILHEDDHLVVVNKPAGLVVHPSPGTPNGTLVNALLHHCLGPGGGLSGIGGAIRPGIVHRLDKDTSGVLVVAKNDITHQGLAEQFQAHTASRHYLAVIKGVPRGGGGELSAPIGRHPKHRQRQAVTPRGREAITHYQTLEHLPPFTLVQCRLETGRTHQIRVHMAHLGHPLLGDPLYARPFNAPGHWPDWIRQVVSGFKRQALHAASLGFLHPVTGEKHLFEIPPPEDFQNLLKALRSLE
ncbi:MAG: RluA family pseudouridine synthase [Magnetococcales bacterium]|nr:RluA family pseudouridine synthase [Magnetococcales bacterium]